ncbi:MAG: alpha/beta hydrolase [Pseudomonadota bacterium]
MTDQIPPFDLTRISLSTGVELDVALAGAEDAPPLILLHGFPESHRTWRHQIAHFARTHRVIAPDQRGYAGSSKPEGVSEYTVQKLVGDVVALADALGVDQFALAGHDWGGAGAWATALTHPHRVEKLIIANAPHPYTYQKAIYTDPDQRAATQYITAFRGPDFEAYVERKGWDAYYKENFADHVQTPIPEEERQIYLQQWQMPGAFTAMINWYRASAITIPPVDYHGPPPPAVQAFLDKPFPVLKMPVLLIWAMDDHALRPSLLDGIHSLIAKLMLVKLPGGHFVTWENHEAVTDAMDEFLNGDVTPVT